VFGPERELPMYPLDDAHWDDPLVAEHYVLQAQRVVVGHREQVMGGGSICTYDQAAYPCRWSTWGRRVLTAVGWNDEDVAHLLLQADAGVPQW
jgi:hypothetical protein